MNERSGTFDVAGAPAPTLEHVQQLTGGAMLRQARESHGLHIETVAAALKVPVRKLQALEDDALELLPDQVFARALAASVARALRIDPAPVLARLPKGDQPGLPANERAMSTGFRTDIAPGARGAAPPSRALWWLVALLLAAAGVLFLLPQAWLDSARDSISRLTRSSGSEAEPVLPPAAGGVSEPASGGVASGGATGSADAGSAGRGNGNGGAAAGDGANAPGAPSAGVDGAATPPVTTAGPASSTAGAATPGARPSAPSLPVATASGALPAGTSPVEFITRAESWISVNDAQGTVLLKRIVKAGETVNVSGSLPLSVVVGRAESVDVKVKGESFDLKPFTKGGGAARFEVKP
ncbi:MAG: RodZ domain-containing protein [Variovorax sp.]